MNLVLSSLYYSKISLFCFGSVLMVLVILRLLNQLWIGGFFLQKVHVLTFLLFLLENLFKVLIQLLMSCDFLSASLALKFYT